MATVSFKGATRIYPGNPTPAVNQLNLEINDGEFVVSSDRPDLERQPHCGCLPAWRTSTRARYRSAGRTFRTSPPKDRDIAMVFQNYALYPHMSVADNMGFALKLKGIKKEERMQRVREAARLLDLEPYLDRKPKALSGGQRQRVAMGRAIVREPAVFLMDEPLSNLDAKLHVQIRAEVSKLQHTLNVTTVYVTHDQIEAMTMGDRVTVL